jgi:hypothetical protein
MAPQIAIISRLPNLRKTKAAGSGGRGGPAWPKKKGTGTMAGPPIALAFGNNRRRGRRFALAVRCSVGLCRGRDAKESYRRCRQQSECFHGTLLLFAKGDQIPNANTAWTICVKIKLPKGGRKSAFCSRDRSRLVGCCRGASFCSADQGGGKRRAAIQYLDSFGGSPHSHLPVSQL